MSKPLMGCGCVAMGTRENGDPICVSHAGIDPGATEIVERPSIEGRQAKCSDCGRTAKSDWDLPFFRYQPDRTYDEFYNGCRGWG